MAVAIACDRLMRFGEIHQIPLLSLFFLINIFFSSIIVSLCDLWSLFRSGFDNNVGEDDDGCGGGGGVDVVEGCRDEKELCFKSRRDKLRGRTVIQGGSGGPRRLSFVERLLYVGQ